MKSEYYFTEMPFYNEKAQYFQRSFVQNYDLSEETSVDYVKRKGLMHLFGFTVLSKKGFNFCVTKSFRYWSNCWCADTNLGILNRFLFEFWTRSEVMCFLLSRVRLASLFAGFEPVGTHSSSFIQCIYSLKASNIKAHLSSVLGAAMNNEIWFQKCWSF